MLSKIKFYCLFVMFMSSKINLACLPERQVWAILIICILKNQFYNYLSQNVVQYVFLGVFEYGEFISDIIFV